MDNSGDQSWSIAASSHLSRAVLFRDQYKRQGGSRGGPSRLIIMSPTARLFHRVGSDSSSGGSSGRGDPVSESPRDELNVSTSGLFESGSEGEPSEGDAGSLAGFTLHDGSLTVGGEGGDDAGAGDEPDGVAHPEAYGIQSEILSETDYSLALDELPLKSCGKVLLSQPVDSQPPPIRSTPFELPFGRVGELRFLTGVQLLRAQQLRPMTSLAIIRLSGRSLLAGETDSRRLQHSGGGGRRCAPLMVPAAAVLPMRELSLPLPAESSVAAATAAYAQQAKGGSQRPASARCVGFMVVPLPTPSDKRGELGEDLSPYIALHRGLQWRRARQPKRPQTTMRWTPARKLVRG